MEKGLQKVARNKEVNTFERFAQQYNHADGIYRCGSQIVQWGALGTSPPLIFAVGHLEIMNIYHERKIIQCNYDIADEDWRCIEVFRRRAAEFIEERQQVNTGKFAINFSRKSDGNLTGNAPLPPERDLKHFYLAFRFFYHQREPSNFHKVVNIVSKAIDEPLVRDAIKRIKAQWKGSFADQLSKFHGEKYSSEEFIDSWFNAHYFHTDGEKEQSLNKLNTLLSNELSRTALFMAVWDAGLAISNLFEAVKDMGRTTGGIALPFFMHEK